MKNKISPQEFATLIQDLPPKFLLTSHIHPDGDGLGAMVGMGLALKSLGCEVRYVLRDPVRPYYLFLQELHAVQFECVENPQDWVLMSFDSSSPDILSLPDGWRNWGSKLIVLDHHFSNAGFGDYHLVRTDCISSCILAQEAIEAMGVKITSEMATALYLGLIYDTGRFSYTADPAAFESAAKLLRYGADHFAVFNCLYRHNDLDQYHIHAELISKVQSDLNGRYVHLVIDPHYSPKIDLEETEYLVNHIADIKDIEVVVVLKYLNDQQTKLCLRSRGRVSVAELALQYGGGGHRLASGATMDMDLETAQSTISKEIQDLLS